MPDKPAPERTTETWTDADALHLNRLGRGMELNREDAMEAETVRERARLSRDYGAMSRSFHALLARRKRVTGT